MELVYVFVGMLAAIGFWFITGAIKRGAYCSKVEINLRQYGINRKMLVQKYGHKGYFVTIELMHRQGRSPQITAKALFDDMQGAQDQATDQTPL